MRTYYAKRDGITYNGKKYNRGERIEHRLGIRDNQILNSMLRMGKLTLEVPSTVESRPAIPAEDSVQLEPTVAPPVAPDYTLNHAGGGYYEVVKNGVVMSVGVKLKGKDEATKWAVDNL